MLWLAYGVWYVGRDEVTEAMGKGLPLTVMLEGVGGGLPLPRAEGNDLNPFELKVNNHYLIPTTFKDRPQGGSMPCRDLLK